MKSVLISTRPKWVEKICHKIGEDETGKAIYEKRIEVRKTAPQEVPFKAYIYCCKAKPYLYKEANPPFELFLDSELYKGNGYDDRLFSGKVIGEFICDKITDISVVVRNCNEDYNHVYHNDECKGSCLTWKELQEYGKDKPLYGWHISDLKIYDRPRELSDFYRECEKPCKPNKGKILCITTKSLKMNGCNGKIPLTRAPQSWQYIEDLGEEE